MIHLERLANSQIQTILFWHLFSFLALSRSPSIFGTEYNLDILSSVLFWLQDLSIYSFDSWTNWSLVRNFQDCLSGRGEKSQFPFMLAQCFLLKKKSLQKARNQSAQKACSRQPISTYQSRLQTLLDPSHLGNSFLRAFFLLC